MAAAPHILAIETSGRIGGVALARGAELKESAYFQVGHNHAVELLPTIQQLSNRVGWTPAQLEAVFVSIGPGSFTGLRIAVTLARTLALALAVDIVAVPTLKVIAQNALAETNPPGNLAVILDAKRGQIYAAVFELCRGGYRQITTEAVIEPAKFMQTLPPVTAIAGEGIPYHEGALRPFATRQLAPALWQPRVEALHRLGLEQAHRGDFTDPRKLQPKYLRKPEAEEVWEARNR